MKGWIGSFVVVAVLAAFGAAAFAEGEHDGAPAVPEGFFKDASERNGAAIFLDGMELGGGRIRFEGGPRWLYMHGGGCASCHGDNGRGGVVPMMCVKKTPDITLKALMSGEHEHDGGKAEEIEAYTVPDIKRALELSVDPKGGGLDQCMPRWFLGDADFRDLLFYLKRLGE